MSARGRRRGRDGSVSGAFGGTEAPDRPGTPGVPGTLGTLGGAAGGYLVSTVLDRYRLLQLPMEIYQVSYVPFTVRAFDMAAVVGVALVVCFAATVYPSRQASRLDPAEALRYQ